MVLESKNDDGHFVSDDAMMMSFRFPLGRLPPHSRRYIACLLHATNLGV